MNSLPGSKGALPSRFNGLHARPKNAPIPLTRSFAEVEMRDVAWLWEGRIPIGKLTLLAGEGGLGKSTLAYDIASRVSIGAEMPDGSPPICGEVLIISAEDDSEDIIKPRLMAAGADPAKIHEIREKAWNLAAILKLKGICEENANLRLIIIDPITAFLPPRADSHKVSDIRAALSPLSKLAEDLGIAVVLVSHLSKGGTDGPAAHRVVGSVAFVHAVRSVLMISADNDDRSGSRRLLGHGKSNVGILAKTLSFHIDPVEVQGLKGDYPRLVWDGDDPRTVEEFMRRGAQADGSALVEAMTFLQQTLTEPRPQKEIESESELLGISRRTLERAKTKLKVKSVREGDRWIWRF